MSPLGKFRNVNNWSYDSIKGCVKLFTQLIRTRIGTIQPKVP
jgi:hypothetical protein